MEGISGRSILVGNSAPPESDNQIIGHVVPICKYRKHQPAGIDEAQDIYAPQILLSHLEMSPHFGFHADLSLTCCLSSVIIQLARGS